MTDGTVNVILAIVAGIVALGVPYIAYLQAKIHKAVNTNYQAMSAQLVEQKSKTDNERKAAETKIDALVKTAIEVSQRALQASELRNANARALPPGRPVDHGALLAGPNPGTINIPVADVTIQPDPTT